MPTAEQLREALKAEGCSIWQSDGSDGVSTMWIADDSVLTRIAARLSRLDAGGGGENACLKCDDSGWQDFGSRREICDCPCGQSVGLELSQPRTDGTFKDGFEAAKKAAARQARLCDTSPSNDEYERGANQTARDIARAIEALSSSVED